MTRAGAGWMIAMAMLTVLSAGASAQAEGSSVNDKEFARYKAENDAETRLREYADDDEVLALKVRQLAYINRSRKAYRLTVLELDIFASRVANRMAAEAADENFIGHWNMRGELPYHRYGLAGGYDHVTENAAAMSSSGQIKNTIASMEDFMRKSHDYFMAEKPPADGHKQAIIDPAHTHVGLGIAISGKEARYYEEFIDRYLEFVSVPGTLKQGEQADIIVKPIAAPYNVEAAIVYYEPPLKPLSPSLKRAMRSYGDFTNEIALEYWPWDLEQNADGTWTIPFSGEKEGLYYVKIYLGTKPLTGNSYSTEGKITGSGIVIRVTR